MEHSVASQSLMAGTFACFPSLSTFFSRVTDLMGIYGTLPTKLIIEYYQKLGSKGMYLLFCSELEAFKNGT